MAGNRPRKGKLEIEGAAAGAARGQEAGSERRRLGESNLARLTRYPAIARGRRLNAVPCTDFRGNRNRAVEDLNPTDSAG